jgi:AraC family transcriptional regulator
MFAVIENIRTMNKQTIYIKNMCCQRCIEAVQDELTNLKLVVEKVQLGKAVFLNSPKVKMEEIERVLLKRGFELIVSEEAQIVEAVKIALIELVRHSEVGQENKTHLSDFLEQRVKKPYRYIHKVFLNHTNLNIENYLILQRIEKVKELIQQSRLNFSEIADATGYKTLPHLSGQFKKITGMTMMEYKNNDVKDRKPLDFL